MTLDMLSIDYVREDGSHARLAVSHDCLRAMTTRNMWGDMRELINPAEFCPDCEHNIPRHYTNCPTRKVAS